MRSSPISVPFFTGLEHEECHELGHISVLCLVVSLYLLGEVIMNSHEQREREFSDEAGSSIIASQAQTTL